MTSNTGKKMIIFLPRVRVYDIMHFQFLHKVVTLTLSMSSTHCVYHAMIINYN